MGVLEYIMIILLLLAAFMIVVRIRLGVSEKKEEKTGAARAGRPKQ